MSIFITKISAMKILFSAFIAVVLLQSNTCSKKLPALMHQKSTQQKCVPWNMRRSADAIGAPIQINVKRKSMG
jgi:hypothetical protein